MEGSDRRRDEDYVNMQRFVKLEQRVEKLELLFNDKPSVPIKPKKETLREFIKGKQPRNDVERTICILYYRELTEGMGETTSTDLKNGFRHAREKVPANVSAKLGLCAKRGFIDSVREEKGKIYWSITNTGIDFVDGLKTE